MKPRKIHNLGSSVKVNVTLSAAICLLFFSGAYADSAGRSGEHGNTTTCARCHVGSAFNTTASISDPGPILHGQNSGTFTLSGSGGIGRGFNLAIYRVNGNTLQTTGYNTLGTGVQNLNNELAHTQTALNRNTWTFKWTAPNTLGTYRAYACVSAVDSTGTDTGDGKVQCVTRNISVTNNNPIAVNDPNILTVGEDSGLSGAFNVLTNDQETENDAFSWDSTNTTGLVGTLTDNSNGTYRYNPDGLFETLDDGESSTTSFTYTIVENSYSGFTNTATATITINGANDAPVASADGSNSVGLGHVVINEGAAAVSVGDLLANDTDVDIENLSAVRTGAGVPVECSATNPSESSSFNLNPNGTFSYTHDGIDPVTEQDSFSYCAYDGTAYSAAVLVFIDIAIVNDKPEISTSVGNTLFTEQTPVIVDTNVTLVDTDSTHLDRAFVTISSNYVAGEDTLNCTTALPFNGITSCDFSEGTLTISSGTGSALIADYKTVIEGVQFDSSSDNPDLAAKTIDFSIRDDALATSTAAQKIITITRINDAPTLEAVNPPTIDSKMNHAYENTTADPFIFTITALASDVDVNDDINNGGGSLTYSLSGAPAGMTISNDSPTQGKISWNPPMTGNFEQIYGPITVSIEDGDEDTSAPDTVNFNLTVSPPDNDLDGFANYVDLCLTIADVNNADYDNDGVAGSDGGTNTGGDVCDLDDDNDNIPDEYESANFLNPMDASDAIGDNDNDGISNLQEFLDGTNPNLANLVIDATGYLTPFLLTPPLPTLIHAQAIAVSTSDNGPYRPGRITIIWTAANGNNNNLGTIDQTLDIRPLVSFEVDQQVKEGSDVAVVINLNGSPPAYPVTVNYTVSGTASNPADHNAAAGVVTFNSPSLSEVINFNVAADAVVDSNETVMFTIDSATNAAVGSSNTHLVTIPEENITPTVDLQVSQAGPGVVASAFVDQGTVTVDAMVIDANVNQSHTLDWSGSSNSLTPPSASNVTQWSFTPVVGNYLIDLIISDNGSPVETIQVSRVLKIFAAAPALLAVDTDGDGNNDDTEGYDDGDGDGIPDYLDANEIATESNLIPDQTVDIPNSVLIVTESGLKLAVGNTAQAASNSATESYGALLTDTEITQFGSANGSAPTNPTDTQNHIGGIYDFAVSGLVPGGSARIVIPLQSAIPKGAEYRKFNPATGWTRFVEDNNNSIASAIGEPGACPEPGSSEFQAGLNYLYNCIQLTIQDGGPNDTDNSVNGVVTDPGTVGIKLSDPVVPVVEKGGGRLSPLMLLILLMLSRFGIWRQVKAN